MLRAANSSGINSQVSEAPNVVGSAVEDDINIEEEAKEHDDAPFEMRSEQERRDHAEQVTN